jgi:glucosamine--fructose-6-phosphate aminotransferase (isomerizing)
VSLGALLEAEIREQPDAWERLARGDAARALAGALAGDVVLVGSGSSLFAAQLGALALRAQGIPAYALAATEAQFDHRGYRGRVVLAISQSGRSSDVLAALDALAPKRTIALTNTAQSPLGERADLTIDIGAGPEHAIPATKSVTATIAVLLDAAYRLGGDDMSGALIATAERVRAWLAGSQIAAVVAAAKAIAQRRDIVFLGTAYGAPVAYEAALKFKESTYLHAEGFQAGEFRHGSAAMVDARSVVIGIMDAHSEPIVARPLRDAAQRNALRYCIGPATIDGVERLGATDGSAFDPLAWLVTIQCLALHVARELRIDSDVPRGLTKAIVTE